MAYYSMAFDQALDHVFDQLGVGAAYTQSENASCFALQVQIFYVRELRLNDPFRVTFQLLDRDSKRMHFFEQMYHAKEGYLAATMEQMSMHVDMTTRRACPFPLAVQQRIDALWEQHKSLPTPTQVGRKIEITRRT